MELYSSTLYYFYEVPQSTSKAPRQDVLIHLSLVTSTVKVGTTKNHLEQKL